MEPDMRKMALVVAMLALAAGCQQQQNKPNAPASASTAGVRSSALDVTGPAANGTPMYKPSAAHAPTAVIPPNEPAISQTPVLDAPISATPAMATDKPAGATKAAAHTKRPAPVKGAPPAEKPAVALAGNSYKVKKGDTLFAIAKTQYGDGKQWQKIASANPGVSPSTLHVGQTLVIPQ
jgi:nucleoid-associated protein YgaU